MAQTNKAHSPEAYIRWGRMKANSTQATDLASGHIGKGSHAIARRVLKNQNPVIQHAAGEALNHFGQKGLKKVQPVVTKKLATAAAKHVASKGAKGAAARLTVKGLTALAEDTPVVGAVVGGTIGAYHGVKSWHSHKKAETAAGKGDFDEAAKHLDNHHHHKRQAIVNAGSGAVSLIPGVGTAAAVAIQAGDLVVKGREPHTRESAKLHFQQKCSPRTQPGQTRDRSV